MTDTCDFDSEVMPSVSTSRSVRRGGDAEQVASDNHGGLCLSALLRRRSNQMLGEVRTGSQLEDRYVEGVEAVVPVAVPAVAALVGALLESAPHRASASSGCG